MSDGLVITGDKNRVVVSLDGSAAPAVRVRRPWRRSQVERLLFGLPESVAASDRPLLWLRSDAGVIRVRPRPEDKSLRTWCDDGPSRVRLVCGRGGQGKTTTARQLIAGVQRSGWLAGFVDLAAVSSGEVESEAVRRRWAELAAALSSGPVRRGRVLLVVDYAENEPLVVRRLLGLVRDAPTVRVLLLSRGEGDWWSGLAADPAWSRLIDTDVVWLRSITDTLTREQVSELWADAVQRFANRAGVAVQPSLVSGRLFTTTLDLFAEALLWVLDTDAARRGREIAKDGGDGGDPIRGLLAHELRHVRGALNDRRIWVEPRELPHLLLAPYLVPAPRLEDARRALGVLEWTGNGDPETLNRAAHALSRLYPDGHDGDTGRALEVWAPPRPDRLPDTHLLVVAGDAASDEDWINLVLRLCGTDDVEHGTRVTLAMARCLSTPGADERYRVGLRRVMLAIDLLVRRHPKGFALPVVMRLPGQFTAALNAVLIDDDSALTTAEVDAIDRAVVVAGPSTRRAADAVLISHRLTRDTTPPSDADQATLARHATELDHLATRLSDVGRREQALSPAQRAIEIRERLAEDNPDAYLPDLAIALNNLANRLAEVGQREQTLELAQRAVEIWERLVEEDPDAYLPNLATSLNNLAIGLAEVGQHKQALNPAQRAIEIRERLAETNPDAYLPNLAISLNTLAIRLSKVGQHEQALNPAQRAVEIYVDLAEANPAAYLPDLAISLNTLAIRLSKVGQHEQALNPAQRAVEIRERLAEANPAAYLPDLALSLNTLATRLTEVGQHKQALNPAQRAVEIYVDLAEVNPDAYLRNLAASLNNLAIGLLKVGQHEQALNPAQRAVEIRERLAEANPDAYLSDLATSLNNLLVLMDALGHPNATSTRQRAETLNKRLTNGGAANF